MPEEERPGFLSRWSRRKRGEEVAEAEASPVQTLPELPVEPTPEALPLAVAEQPEPEFDLASLPPIETLDAASDFSVFLKPGVPQALRVAALRKAWTADPLIRDYMSPLDYAWDFNTPGGLPYGFSNVLAETGEALRKLISQAIGEMEPEEEKPEAIALAEVAPPEITAPWPPGVTLEASPEDGAAPPAITEGLADPPPENAIRLSEAVLAALPAAPSEAEPARPRRHGGALPV